MGINEILQGFVEAQGGKVGINRPERAAFRIRLPSSNLRRFLGKAMFMS